MECLLPSYLFVLMHEMHKKERAESHYAPINKWRDLKARSMREQKAKGCEF